MHIVHQSPDGAPVFTPKTALAEEFAELAPKKGEHTITKNYPGSFTATDLDEHLKSLGEKGKQVVLTGVRAISLFVFTERFLPQRSLRRFSAPRAGVQVYLSADTLLQYMAHVCVSTTARQAAEKGYDVILASDAIGDRDIPGASGDEVTKMTLKELGDAFGTVVKGSEIN